MFDILQPAGRGAFVPGITKATDAAMVSRLLAGPAAAAGRGWSGATLPSEFVATVRAPADSRAVTIDAAAAARSRNAEVPSLALARSPASQPGDTGTATRGDGIVGAIEQLVKSLAVGFAVFTVSLAAFMMIFAWWILVVEPIPGIQPLTQVTMPLFPEGYRPPADEPRG